MPFEVELQQFQGEVLEAVARGTPLDEVAALICRRVEERAPGVVCSLIRVRDGRLRPLAAPGLPQAFSDFLEGVAIGPDVGSCGRSAWLGSPVEVRDIATDPLWTDFRAIPLQYGLAACWSTPIVATGGGVIATFALYFRERRGPTDFERMMVEAAAHLGTIAIERSDVEERANRLAYFDPLTELPNRRSFDATIRRFSADPAARFGLLLLYFDGIDSIGAAADEATADRLLREIATRLRGLGPLASAATLGGERFALLVERCSGHAALRAVGTAVVSAFQQPRDWLSSLVGRGLSVGGALFGPDGTTPDELRQNAELARIAAKTAATGDYEAFQPELRADAQRRRALLRDVEAALAERRMLPYYQPVVRVDSGEIVGLEALMRMRTRDGHIVTAGAFEEAFRDPRLSSLLTDRLLADVARDAAAWLRQGIDFGHIGINLTMADFLGQDLPGRLEGAFMAAGVPLDRIIVEVTEYIVMDDPRHDVADMVRRLQGMGTLVALDDFGTGFASLTHLMTFPCDIIKIDRSFIDRLLLDPHSDAIIEALVRVAQRLDKRLVAEGIETAAQAQRLAALGCQLGQGFHFARPADALTTTERLGARRRVAV